MSELTFAVLDIVAEPYAAAPTCSPPGCGSRRAPASPCTRIALRCQVRIEPQRRRYDDAEEPALLDLFGDRDRWSHDAQAVPVDAVQHHGPGLHRRDRGRPAAARAPTTSRSPASKYLHALRDGEIPLVLLFSGTVFTRGATGFASSRCRGTARRATGCRWRSGGDLMDAYFPNTGWMRLRPRHASTRSRTTGRRAASPPGTTRSTALLAEAAAGAGEPAVSLDAGPRRRRRRPLRGLPALPLPGDVAEEPGRAGSSASWARRARRPPASGRSPRWPCDCLLRPAPRRRGRRCTCGSCSCSGAPAERGRRRAASTPVAELRSPGPRVD